VKVAPEIFQKNGKISVFFQTFFQNKIILKVFCFQIFSKFKQNFNFKGFSKNFPKIYKYSFFLYFWFKLIFMKKYLEKRISDLKIQFDVVLSSNPNALNKRFAIVASFGLCSDLLSRIKELEKALNYLKKNKL
jgi:hypothetical protein